MSEAIPYISLLLIVFGWFVANHQANRREERKEARALVDESRKRIAEITTASLSYEMEGKAELTTTIKSSLDLLEVDLRRMPHMQFKGSPLLRALVDFQDAVTGGDFESADHPKRTFVSPEVQAILRTRNALIAELERQFAVFFK